jgi:large subunit ribosomal protein L3
MGDAQKTSKNLVVVAVDAERNLLMIRGAVPGPAGAYVVIKKVQG